MLIIHDLTINIFETNETVLDKINLSIKPGEIVLLTGPNGSGKSTLAKAILGHPTIKTTGKISIEKIDISKFPTAKRAQTGVFLAHQTPPEIPGVKYVQFLREAYNSQHEAKDRIDVWQTYELIEQNSKPSGLESNLLERDLNSGFSGGERKKSELLQLLTLKPKYAILDEIDSGMDIKSVKITYKLITEMAKTNKTGFLIISHNPNIEKLLKIDKKIEIKDKTVKFK